MKQIKHIILEIILLVALVIAISMLMRHRLETDFQLKNGNNVAVKLIGENQYAPTLAVLLDGQVITDIVPGGDVYSIRILTKDGNNISAEFQKDQDIPRSVTRSLEIGGKRYGIIYNDVGEVDKKVEEK